MDHHHKERLKNLAVAQRIWWFFFATCFETKERKRIPSSCFKGLRTSPSRVVTSDLKLRLEIDLQIKKKKKKSSESSVV